MAVLGMYVLGGILTLIALYLWNTKIIGTDTTWQKLKVDFGWALIFTLFSWVSLIIMVLLTLYILGSYLVQDSELMKNINKTFRGEEDQE